MQIQDDKETAERLTEQAQEAQRLYEEKLATAKSEASRLYQKVETDIQEISEQKWQEFRQNTRETENSFFFFF